MDSGTVLMIVSSIVIIVTVIILLAGAKRTTRIDGQSKKNSGNHKANGEADAAEAVYCVTTGETGIMQNDIILVAGRAEVVIQKDDVSCFTNQGKQYIRSGQ